MNDAQKVGALRSLLNDVLYAYDMTVYDMDDPGARAVVNKWSSIYSGRMLDILNSDDED